LAQGTATARPDYNDEAAARSAVEAALGIEAESTVEGDASDTEAASTAADDVEDSDESAEETEETTDEGTESEDEEADEVEGVEAKEEPEDDSPFSASDKAAIAADPKLAKLAKGLQKSYTKKMQELGETSRFQKLLNGDPKTVLQRIAEANGLKVKFDGESVVAPAATTSPAASTDSLAPVLAGVRAKWVPIIGEEAADQLLSGMHEIVTAATDAKVAPITRGIQAREQASVQAQVDAEFKRFTDEHPDWKQYEGPMAELAAKINPQMGAYETSKFLYDNVTKGKQIAKAKTDTATKLAAKVKKSVADAEPAPRTRVPGTVVKQAPKSYATAEDAVKASLAEMGYSL